MRQKSTVVSSQVHNQYETKIKMDKDKLKLSNTWKKEEKEGQSEYRVEKTTGRQIITR